jgi:hypothetical protein
MQKELDKDHMHHVKDSTSSGLSTKPTMKDMQKELDMHHVKDSTSSGLSTKPTMHVCLSELDNDQIRRILPCESVSFFQESKAFNSGPLK